MTVSGQGPLAGIRIIEIEGLGPAPFACMHLADMGAEIILVERPGSGAIAAGDPTRNILNRGKRSIVLDLKTADDAQTLLKLVKTADGLIEGMRPGVMERLGLGPDVCLKVNPALVYGRLTGWGQTGPLSHVAGHDINYAALSGAAWYSGRAGDAPVPPPSLIADIAGGAHYMVIGLLAALLKAKSSGTGDVIDTAMVDGSAHMMNLMLALQTVGGIQPRRGRTLLDGPHWYDMYVCKDGRYVSIGPLEPQFYALFLEKMNLMGDPDFTEQFNPAKWPAQKQKLADIFAGKDAEHWCDLLEGTDVCFAPALDPWQASEHPHMKSRETYVTVEGILQAQSAPRFESQGQTTVLPSPAKGQHTAEILAELLAELPAELET